MRTSAIERITEETNIKIELEIDGKGKYSIETPIGMLTHLLEAFARHGHFDLSVHAEGDLQVDQHHLVEDVGYVLGTAFRKALGDKKGINRSGYFVMPMDEALAIIAVDLSGRPFLQFESEFKRRFCGDLDLDLMEDFFRAFANGGLMNLVVRIPFGRSDHHRIEAAFKGCAKAMKMACSLADTISDFIPSTKGVIDDSDN